MRLTGYLSLTALCFLTAACGPGPNERQFVDQGNVCLGERSWIEAERAITTGTAIPVTVLMTCASSSCTKDRSASCSTALEKNNTVILRSKGSLIRSDSHYYTPILPKACTADCSNDMNASCEIPPLEAGSYTLIHGDDRIEFAVPTTNPPCRW